MLQGARSLGLGGNLLQRIRITSFVWLQKICWAAVAQGAAVDDVGVDHRGVQVTVSQ